MNGRASHSIFFLLLLCLLLMWVADGRVWWPAVLTVVPLPPLPSASRLRAWNDGTRLSNKLPQPDDTWHASPPPAKSWYTVRCLTSVLPNLIANEAEAFFFYFVSWRKLSVSFFCPLHVTLQSSSYKSLYHVFVTWAEAIISKLLSNFLFFKPASQRSFPAFWLFNNKTCWKSFTFDELQL